MQLTEAAMVTRRVSGRSLGWPRPTAARHVGHVAVLVQKPAQTTRPLCEVRGR
jgi:hypothetical protein